MYKIIVVEDENLVRKGIVQFTNWQALGCEVVAEAEDGEKGLEAIIRYQPDIVITDVRMPKLDGIGMIQKAVNHCHASFIILSAYSEFSYAQAAIRLGIAEYLVKPFREGELEKAIQNILSKKNETKRSEESFPPLAQLELHLKMGKKSNYIEQALNYVNINYHEDITVGSVAEYLGISEGYLSRVFKKETGYTFMTYLTYYRIQTAMRLLKDCRTKVYEVAEQIGYTDTKYFSSQFKKLVGITPSEYKDQG